MFEKATRLKLRFRSVNGIIGIEDLWDLSLTHLNTIAKILHKSLEDSDVSFISEIKKDEALQLSFDIVKRVIDVKLQEREEAKVRQANIDRKSKLLQILASKQDEALGEMSQEDLLKELESLSV